MPAGVTLLSQERFLYVIHDLPYPGVIRDYIPANVRHKSAKGLATILDVSSGIDWSSLCFGEEADRRETRAAVECSSSLIVCPRINFRREDEPWSNL